MNKRKWFVWTGCFLGLFAVFVSTKATVFAQEEIPLPISWIGEGHLAVMLEGDQVDTAWFDVDMAIDEDGYVSGKITSEEKTAKLQRFYYTMPSDGIRQVFLVFVTQDKDEPMLAIFDGKSLKDKLYFGDVYVKPFEKEGKIEKDLDIGNLLATEMWSDYVPSALKNAIKESDLVGCFAIKGEYKKD